MDDFTRQAQIENQMEINRREMARRSRDTLRIYNPLDTTFRYQWDGFWNSVPAKGYKDVERYLANHYFKKIGEYIIGQQMLRTGEELLALREKQFGKSFIDKYEENREVWDKTPRLDDEELLRQVKKTVIIGLVEEYGMELPEEPKRDLPRLDMRTLHDRIFSEDDMKLAPKMDLAKEVTQEA